MFCLFGSVSEQESLGVTESSFPTRNISWEQESTYLRIFAVLVEGLTSTSLQNTESISQMIASCLDSVFVVLSSKPLFMQKEDPV